MASGTSGIVCFNCMGCGYPTDNSFSERQIRYGANLYRNANEEEEYDSSIEFSVFGFDFIEEATFLNQLDIIFNIARQKFARLERCSFKTGSGIDEKPDRFGIIRQDISLFLVRLRQFIKRCTSYGYTSTQGTIISTILGHLKDFVICVGHIRNISSHILLNFPSKQSNIGQSIEYQFLHLHLDIRWCILTILFELPSSYLDSCSSDLFLPSLLFEKCTLPPFEQYAQLLIWDLIGIGLQIFQKVSLSEYTQITPFPCSCYREFWSSLIFLLNYRHDKEDKDAFWTTMHNTFRMLLHGPSNDTGIFDKNQTNSNDCSAIKLAPDLGDVNRLGICWWLLCHLAPLSSTQNLTHITHSCQNQSNYFEVKNLCKLTVSSEIFKCGERQFRCYLNCCISICKLWDVSVEIPLLLWEYFWKRINEDFLDIGETSTFISKASGQSWLKFIKCLKNDDEPIPEYHTSYHVFLKLIVVELTKSKQAESLREWKQLKGRIFAKFHPRKMLELNITGLHNCFSLFLTLASVADLDDIVEKICDLLDLMDPTLLETAKYCVIWRALFALMLLSEEYQHDIRRPAQKIADDIDAISRSMSGNPSDLVQKHMASELLNIYLEGLQDVFEHSSNLNLSEYILIASSFSDLLAEADPDHLQIALTAVQVILARHRMMMIKNHQLAENCCGETTGGSVEKVHYEALAEALWAYVRPLLNERTIGVLPHQLLANVATAFTFMALDKPARPSCPLQETFTNLVQYFGFRLQTRAELCCQYLINLLEHPGMIVEMESCLPEYQSHVMRAWFRLGIEIPQLLDYDDLTKLVFNLPEMVSMFNEVHCEPYSSRIQENPLVFFLSSIQLWSTKKVPNKYISQQKMEIYLSDIIPLLNLALKNNLQRQITRIYDIVGRVVHTTSSLIYVKGKLDCFLHKIVTAVLLPPTIYNKEKPVHPIALSALKADLHLFIEGIAKLGYRRDPYINRTLKDVLVNYLPRFPLSSQSPGTPMHPIVAYALSVIRKSDMDIALFIIEVVKENYLEKVAVRNRLQIGLDFMSEVLMRCSSKDQAAICPVLLASLLKLLLLLDDSDTKSRILNLVKMVVSPAINVETEICRTLLQSRLQHLIRQHIGSYSEKVFRLLGLLTEIYPDTLGSLVPFIAAQISDIEQKKGGGNDDSLRTKYRQFLATVEIARLRKRPVRTRTAGPPLFMKSSNDF